jgi:uncharacterized protein (DUF1810 family)
MTSPDGAAAARDPFDLDRFVAAQAAVWPTPLAELTHGRKASHWMWFVFPQVAGLGHSAMAQRYVIASLAEARAYLAHPLLGGRLHECLAALAALPPTGAAAVFGAIDAVKLRSSLTLFDAAGGGPAFATALDRWCGGERDPATLARL